MNAIIFGINGQDGFYLSELLKRADVEVIGIGRPETPVDVDIRKIDDVLGLVDRHKPDYIFHFAANSTTRHDVWVENHETICTGSLNILEAVKTKSPKSKVFLSGSGLQFINQEKPINEFSEFEAKSMYAASRIYSTYAARYYRSLGVNVYIGYFFNHDSPRRSERHVNKKIIETARRISGGSKELLTIGDWEVKKEFGYAADIVEAVWKMIQQDIVWEAVIGTGEAYQISDWLEICFSRFELDWKKYTRKAMQFQPEYSVLVSDPTTMHSIGWQHKTTIQELANLMSV